MNTELCKKALARDISTILASLKNKMFISVVLYGGYGRGEGGWIIGDNGTYSPYNDYDILLVVDKKLSSVYIERLRVEIARQVGIRWIDIGQKSPAELKRLKQSIYSYDLKYASTVIEGDPDVLNLIPDISANTLPMKECETLFITRLWTLLGSLGEYSFADEYRGDNARFFRNQMAKAILAVADVLLLAKGAYDPSYGKRVEQVARLYPQKKELIKLSRWALSEKLRPQAPTMHIDEVRELYASVHTHYFKEMYQGLSMYYRKAINEPRDIEISMKYLPRALVDRAYWIARHRNMLNERKVHIALAQSYIAAAWSPDGVDEDRLKRGVVLLHRLDRQLPSVMTWDEARLKATHLRMSI